MADTTEIFERANLDAEECIAFLSFLVQNIPDKDFEDALCNWLDSRKAEATAATH